MEIPDGAFFYHKHLKRVGFEAGVRLERIGRDAFSASNLRVFTAPLCLREICEDAFFGCRKLRQVVLNEGLEILGKGCFRETGLRQIRIPASVREVGEGVFRGCWALSLIEIVPESPL